MRIHEMIQYISEYYLRGFLAGDFVSSALPVLPRLPSGINEILIHYQVSYAKILRDGEV